MSYLRLTTAGESHGPAQLCILEGLPAGLTVDLSSIHTDLERRRRGHGRGGRMSIETDMVEVMSGVRQGSTLGTPIALLVGNNDHANWRPAMQPESVEETAQGSSVPAVTVPRPGHADYAGAAKFTHADIRNVLERSSARETVMRVAAGALAKTFLAAVGVTVKGYVVRLGSAQAPAGDPTEPQSVDWKQVERSPSGLPSAAADEEAVKAVEEARRQGDSLGGVFEVWAWGQCPGLGHAGSYRDRLDGRLMGAVGSIPAVKAVEIGLGFESAGKAGSQVHDAFRVEEADGDRRVERTTNRSGGVEGGMTNGLPLLVRAAMKPIPTLTTPLPSVDMETLEETEAHHERSDIEAVGAARVVGEAMVALELAGAYREKFGGDCLADVLESVQSYEEGLKERGLWRRS